MTDKESARAWREYSEMLMTEIYNLVGRNAQLARENEVLRRTRWWRR
jgi:hypothetical protein